MTLFGGNLSCKIISFELQSRPLLLRLKNPTFIRCATNNHSSGPVKYIPKNPIPNKETQTPVTSYHELEFKDSTKLSREMPTLGKKSRKSTQTVTTNMFYGDGAEFIETEEDEEEVEQTNKSEEYAEKIAIRAIATRAMTAVELQKKLLAKKCTLNVIGKVLNDLQSKGYINDYLYAETFSQSRWSSSTWGPNRIKQALHRKGVSEVNVEKATKHVFESGGGGDDNEPSVLGMSKLSMDHLFVQTSKQWLRNQNVPHDKRKARVIRWLQYRGFNWGVISFILKKLEAKHPP